MEHIVQAAANHAHGHRCARRSHKRGRGILTDHALFLKAIQSAQTLTAGVGVLVHIVVVDVLGNVGEQLSADLVGGTVENDDVNRHVVFHEELTDGVHSHTERLVFGIAVDAGRNQREGHGFTLVRLRQRKARPITGNELFFFSVLAPIPDGANGMDHILARQLVCSRDPGITGLAAAQRSALGQQLRPCRTMDAAVHTAAAQQGLICSVDDGVHSHFGNVVAYDFERHGIHLFPDLVLLYCFITQMTSQIASLPQNNTATRDSPFAA